MSEKQANYYSIAANSIVQASHKIDKPLVVFSNLSGGIHSTILDIFNNAEVPVLQGTTASLGAIKHWVEYNKFNAPHDLPPDSGRSIDAALPAFPENGILAEHAAMSFLRDCGISVNKSVLTTTLEEAESAADEIGYPVVLKVDSSDISHKFQVGAVALNVQSLDELEKRFEEILGNAKIVVPEAIINGISVQKMLDTSEAIEILVGFTVDPQCGPAVMFGIGGVYAEVLNDTTMRLAPVFEDDAAEMLGDIRCAALLENGDRAAIIDILVKLSDVAMKFQNQISQLDVNPLLVFPEGQGAVAVDALITTQPPYNE
jgi:acetyltransferase